VSVILRAGVSDDAGNSFDVDVKPRTVLQWEKRFHGRSISDLDDSYGALYEVVFIAARGQLPEGLTFDQFCEGYDVMPKDKADQPETADPTPRAA
jgi:hypothetical protein